jgi:hypothetical protein
MLFTQKTPHWGRMKIEARPIDYPGGAQPVGELKQKD